ncbi:MULTISPECIES: DMT family transporter [Pseudomonas]|uniref:DMT family transporter n=1 Tax=Pseudomonas TaxID=286 RepID=UPI000B3596AC|nr:MULTISPECIES: DMT family transporter [Pseudomonas]PMY64051.1 membrane protein insertase YidC [Pseudomonas sp. FW305-25]PMY68002.1 membrane protein insertase YidC [Pseudomonas sp. FW126-L8]PNA79350.1 membrane protein insertase YidC [Pseudomonas sp. FW305-76]
MSASTTVTAAENRQSILIVVGSVFLLSVSDAIIKATSADTSMWQLYVIRSLLAIGMLVAWLVHRRGATQLWPLSPFWVGIRSLLLALMWIAFYGALPFISLTIAALAIYTTPLFIALFSAISLKENVTSRKWLAIVLGFVGVVVTLGPSADDFNTWTLLPILAAILYALAMVVTKGKCANEEPMQLALTLNIALLLIGIAGSMVVAQTGPHFPSDEGMRFLVGDWSAMNVSDWWVMVLLAILMVLVSTGIARAYQVGETSIIGAFDYTYLIFAIAWGALLFNEMLNGRTAAGLVLILLSGFILLKNPAAKR